MLTLEHKLLQGNGDRQADSLVKLHKILPELIPPRYFYAPT